MASEFTILRSRVEGFAERLARRRRGSRGTSALCVQVFNDGAIPTTTPAFFDCHPVDVGGDEVEGGPGSFNIGTGIIPVMVIDHVPAVGDMLIARRPGGRWVAERGKTIVGTLTLNVLSCAVPTVGRVITITQGSVSISATTNSLGFATFSLPSLGTWVWTADAVTGYLTVGGPILGLVAGANARTIVLNLDGTVGGYFCDLGGLAGCGMPVTSLTLTWKGIGFPIVHGGMIFTSIFTRDPVSGAVHTPWVKTTDDAGQLEWIRFWFANTGAPDASGVAYETNPFVPMPPDTHEPIADILTTLVISDQICDPYSITFATDSFVFLGGTMVH